MNTTSANNGLLLAIEEVNEMIEEYTRDRDRINDSVTKKQIQCAIIGFENLIKRIKTLSNNK